MALLSNRIVPSQILPEILDFTPELLLDDIRNCANLAVIQTVEALEELLKSKPSTSANEEELEKGLVAFQTLLESHVDIAFDFFETWSRRNIFAWDPAIPIVVPQQEGLNLDTKPEQEAELFTEIEDLRRKIDNQRRLRLLLKRGCEKQRLQGERARKRVEDLKFLEPLLDHNIKQLPQYIESLYESMKTLPQEASPPPPSTLDPSKPLWQQSENGYLQWAVQRLINIARSERRSMGGSGLADLKAAAEQAVAVGSVEDLRNVTAASRAENSLSDMEDD